MDLRSIVRRAGVTVAALACLGVGLFAFISIGAAIILGAGVAIGIYVAAKVCGSLMLKFVDKWI